MPRSPPLEGVRPEAPLFEGGRPEAPLLGKHDPHTGETHPLRLPISPKGGRGETFPQASPHPGCVGNVGGMPPTHFDCVF
jgi:hypothetical protein